MIALAPDSGLAHPKTREVFDPLLLRAVGAALRRRDAKGPFYAAFPGASLIPPWEGAVNIAVPAEVPEEPQLTEDAVMRAIAGKKHAVLRRLLERGADPRGMSMLSIRCPHITHAVIAGDPDAVRILAEYGADLNVSFRMRRPIFEARTPAMIHLLARLGAEVDGKGAYGRTALFFAEDSLCTAALIEEGADVTMRDAYGDTPLHFGHNELRISVLCGNGADPDAKDKLGRTPAFTVPNHDCILTLSMFGAQVAAPDNEGNLPVFLETQ